jgi:myosin heavy subunit
MAYKQGTAVWIKHDEEVWVQAEVVTSTEKETIVKLLDDPNKVITLTPQEEIKLRSEDNFTAEGLTVLDDLTQLTHLHEPAVLSSLQNRFDVDKIYTFTGPILIALNPFKRIPKLYDDDVLRSFIDIRAVGDEMNKPKPHAFTLANAAFKGICGVDKAPRSQTVLISGESGAGKTETTKFVMKFLATAGANEGEVTDVERQVLDSNPLLEAFGNAKTLRNDNSSRFGKFIELQFQSKRLCGARIQTYLLEKVRVSDQQEGERNYHYFYEACAAFKKAGGKDYSFPQTLPKEKVKAEAVYDLDGFGDCSEFAYLSRSTRKTLKGVDDLRMFEERLQAL